MNSDSYFDSDFFQENKTLITIGTTLSLVFFSIYYIYKSLNLNDSDNIQENQGLNQQNSINNNNTLNNPITTNNNNNQINLPKISNKKKLMINGSSIFLKENDLKNLDISLMYQFLDKLSHFYDLYLVFLIDNENQIKEITEKLDILTEDKIILKHRILFASKFEGICAMVRSIDPFAHIEGKNFLKFFYF